MNTDKLPDAQVRIPFDPTSPDGLMVFDGMCNFCSAQVQWLLRIDPAGAIRFTAIQSPYGRWLAARHGLDPDDPSTFLFFEHGIPLSQSDAMIAIARRLPWPWRALQWLVWLPRSLRNSVYRVVARNRYRIAGQRDTCMMPTSAQRARFIEAAPLRQD